MKSALIIILICFCFTSCKYDFSKSDKEELLAGKEYKYWIQVPDNREDSMTNRISYYDRENKNIGYFYNTIKKTFYLPKFGDALYRPYWKFINDTIINEGGKCYLIKTLTTTDFIVKDTSNGRIFHYRVAPIEIIPQEYRKIQSIPEALQGLENIDSLTNPTTVVW